MAKRKLPKTMSEKTFKEGLKGVLKNNHKIAFMLGFYQCMRVSEIVKLRPEDIDRNRGFIHILDAKGGKDRDIPIMPPVERGLRFLPVKVGCRALQKALKKHWPEHKFHDLRHSGATYYVNEKRVDTRLIQQLLGHARLDTTQIYTHITPDNLKAGFNEVWE